MMMKVFSVRAIVASTIALIVAMTVTTTNAQNGGFCEMCNGLGVPARQDRIIPFLAIGTNENPSCSEVDIFGSTEISETDEVCKIIRDHANFCGCAQTNGIPPNFCSLCPDKANPTLLGAVTPYEDTCGELDNYLRFLPADQCDTERVEAMKRADAFCGCPGTLADCYMCPDNTNNLSNPDRLVPFYEFLANSFSTTCQDLADFYTLYDTEDPEISTCEFVQIEATYCGCQATAPNLPVSAMGVCVDRSVPAFPLKFIDEIGMTCGDLNSYLNHQPATQVEMPWNTDLQRFDYFCGCPGVTAPCPICSDGTTDVSRPDAIIPYLIIPNNENPTCRELATLGVIADPGELVLDDCSIFSTQADFCGCPNANPPANECQFCPGGVAPPNPDQVTPFGDTCAELSEYLSYLPADQCNTDRVGFIQRQDFLCGCPTATTNCALCSNNGDNAIQNADRRIPLLSLPLNTNPTCQEVVEFMAVNDGDLSEAGCSALQSYAGYCGCSATPPVNACSFCPNGGTPANPTKVVSELFTCQALYDFVSFLPAEDCSADAADFDQIQAFAYTCGCPNTQAACSLCPNDFVETPNALTSDGETTCSEFAELVRSLTADQCGEQSQLILSAANTCCGGTAPGGAGGAGGAGGGTTQQQCAIKQNPELCTTALLDSTSAECDCYAFCGSTFVECQSAQGGLLRTDQCGGTPITGCNRAIARENLPVDQSSNGSSNNNNDSNKTAIIASAVVIPVVLALLVTIYFFTTRKSKAEKDKMNAVESDPDALNLPVAAMEGSLSMADVGVGAMSPTSANGGSIMSDATDMEGEIDPDQKVV